MTSTFTTQESVRPNLLKTPRVISVSQVQATATEVLAARDDADFEIHLLAAINVSGGPSNLTIYLLESGGTVGVTNLIDNAVTVADGETLYIFDQTRIGYLEPGGSVHALCSTSDDFNIYGWGYDYRGAYG